MRSALNLASHSLKGSAWRGKRTDDAQDYQELVACLRLLASFWEDPLAACGIWKNVTVSELPLVEHSPVVRRFVSIAMGSSFFRPFAVEST